MKFTAQLAAAAALLAFVIAAALHPQHGPLPGNPLAVLGVGLIGLGLIRSAQQAIADRD